MQAERRTQGALVIESVPTQVPHQLTQRLEQYQNTRSCNLKGWHLSEDGRGVEGMLISTRFAEATQIHYLQQPAYYRKQITFFKEPIWSAYMCPDAKSPHRNSFLFGKDVGGNEYFQIYYFDLNSGKYTMLTDGTSKNGSVTWSNKGDKFAFNSTRRNNKDHDIWISDLPLSLTSSSDEADSEKESLDIKQDVVLTEGGMWHVLDWSEDDKLLLVMKYVSVNESTIYVLDTETKALTQINPTAEPVAYRHGAFTKGTKNKGIFFASNENSEFQHLRYYDLGNKTFLPRGDSGPSESKKTPSLTGDIPWDVDAFTISDQGDKLAFLTNEDGISQFYVMDMELSPEGDAIAVKSRQKIPIPIGQAYSLRFHPDGQQIGLVLNTPQTPGDIFVLNLTNNKLTRWTFSEVGGLNTEKFVVPDLIHYDTFYELSEGVPRKIPAFYYKPPTSKKGKNGKYPVMIRIHGGPESQSRPEFFPMIQYYCLELGVVALVPNVRGSSGYGKTYLTLDDGYKREDSVKDIGALIDWAIKQPELDAEKIMVNGGSYGGYMVLAAMIHYGEKLRAGVERVGISNWVTFLENTADYRKDLRRVEYGDERIPEMREFLLKISPLTNAHLINKPMLIAQGANDPRVPVGESEQIVEAIRKNDREVWYILAMDEGHGFQKKSNVDFYTTAEVMFTQKFLL